MQSAKADRYQFSEFTQSVAHFARLRTEQMANRQWHQKKSNLGVTSEFAETRQNPEALKSRVFYSRD